MADWHEKDDFWIEMADKIFSTEKWENAPSDVEKIISLLNMKPETYVLDLCCGPGRHSLELARRGFHVVGVDRTSQYIEDARVKARAEKLDVKFEQKDMRVFCQPNIFDVVLNLYTSFGYFQNPQDDRNVIGNVLLSLKPNGRLLLDVMGKEILARIFKERDWYEQDGVLYLEERKVKKDWSWIESRWIAIDGKTQKQFKFGHRIYSGIELSTLLIDTGFRSVQLFGDLDGVPYNNTAKRLVAVAFK